MPVRERLSAWAAWRGWSQEKVGEGLELSQTGVSKILRGGTPSLETAIHIEDLTARPREDGEVWPDGPILAREWVGDDADAANDPSEAA